ncbi:MAG: hypothetical protein ACXWZM_10125, partial [Solirubrobacterales bacterium]
MKQEAKTGQSPSSSRTGAATPVRTPKDSAPQGRQADPVGGSTSPGATPADPAPQPEGPEPRRTALALGLGRRGAQGARRRGAVLRRLLALGDWAALIAALCAATAATA